MRALAICCGGWACRSEQVMIEGKKQADERDLVSQYDALLYAHSSINRREAGARQTARLAGRGAPCNCAGGLGAQQTLIRRARSRVIPSSSASERLLRGGAGEVTAGVAQAATGADAEQVTPQRSAGHFIHFS